MNRDIYVLAYNIRSLYNIGSIFRTCDGANVKKLFLTGYCGTPDNKEVLKTSIGAEKNVKWEFCKDPVEIIRMLRKKNIEIVGLEGNCGGIKYSRYKMAKPVCLILGHEILGIPKFLLNFCDNIVYIPMYGKKKSLNVSVAFGIAVYTLRFNI